MKQGNIYYTDKDFTDLEVSTTFKYPCMLILKNAENEIEKITAYNENGIKSIYDFSLSASKQFVTDSIATANVGSRSQQLSLSSVFIINQNGNANKIDVTAGQLYSQTLDKTWNVSALVSTIPDNDYRYVYAKASKTTSTASIYLSKNQIPFDSDANDFYFLVGVLHSVVDGVRILSLTVGTTTISGGLIRTGIISSLDGLTSFNLNTGEIKGKITFSSGSSGYENLTDKPDLSSFEQTRDYVNSTLQTDLTDLKNRADGVIESWFYSHTPSLSNLPASNWVTTEERNAHIGDTFTNMQEFVDNVTTPDAGKAWRFVKNETTGEFSWSLIANSDSTKALIEAGKAKDTADAKRRVFVSQPYPPYNVGDLWVQGNGGDIMRCKFERLSGSYVATDFEKASKYTDDTAVNNLQIGGRNLVLNSKGDFNIESSTEYSVMLEKGQSFIWSLEVKSSVNGTIDVYFLDNVTGSFANKNVTLTTEFTKHSEGAVCPSWWNIESGILFVYNPNSLPITIRRVKVEKGNKATDWTPAPEDVEASILQSKTDSIAAAKAYSDAQDEVKRIQTQAYADGIVTAAEQRAIDDATAKADAAKVYAAAQDALLKTQLESYADGVVDAEEQARINQAQSNLNAAKSYSDAQDNLAKIAAAAYADGIVDAEEARAIADATAKMEAAKTHAQTLVNNLQIGGRNLYPNSKGIFSNTFVSFGVKEIFTPYIGKEIVISADVKLSENGVFRIYPYQDSGLSIKEVKYFQGTTEWQRFSFVSTVHQHPVVSGYSDGEIGFYAGGANILYIKDFKIELGNKATDWTPAPEDIQLQIDVESAKVINLEHKTDFLTGTTVEGNAIATGTLLVGNSDGTNAGITGLGSSSDGVYLWGGGTYQQMIQGLAKKEQRRNGIDIWRHPNGQIGFEIGIKDGRLIFNGYHESGFKLFELDPNRGLIAVSYTQESWTETPFRKLTYSSSTFDESTIASEIQGFIVKKSSMNYTAPPNYNIDAEFVYLTTYTVLQNAVGYDYDNGTNPANASYESLKGMKANYNDRYTNIANGWYMPNVGEIYMESEWNNYPPMTYTFTVYVYYYQDGKITQTKVVTVTK